jgi:LmeA-like phospholipid-binding
MPENNSQAKGANKIRIITNVLTTALKLWLRAQVSHVSQLEVDIKASDRQLLSGRIPWVSISASNAVYQGLHITRIQLVAENIQINIGTVLKGQPLRLLAPVPVVGELVVEEKDLNSSLSSELLSTALNEVLVKFLPEHCLKSQPISWQKIILENHRIILGAILARPTENTPLEISLGLNLLSNHELQLSHIQVLENGSPLIKGNDDYHIDLGNDVEIQELSVIPGQLVCRGRINVNP